MCFSATASFSASVLIGIASGITFKSAKTPQSKYLGAVPFLFALQQLSEGFVWLSIQQPFFYPYQHFFTLCFLFFAWVVWPILIPVAFYQLEPEGPRKVWCKRLIYVGLISAAYATFNMMAKYPEPDIATFHIIYQTKNIYHHKALFIPHQTLYILATVVPMFLSSLRSAKLLAFTNFAALIICFGLFQFALPSTWCFFAAFLSLIIFWILKKNVLDPSQTERNPLVNPLQEEA